MIVVLSRFEYMTLLVLVMAMLYSYICAISEYKRVITRESVRETTSISVMSVVFILVAAVSTMYTLISFKLITTSISCLVSLFVITSITYRILILKVHIMSINTYKRWRWKLRPYINAPIAIGILGMGYALFSAGLITNIQNNNGDIPVIWIAAVTLILAVIVYTFTLEDVDEIKEAIMSIKSSKAFIAPEVLFLGFMLLTIICFAIYVNFK